jgi:hypothetical protein
MVSLLSARILKIRSTKKYDSKQRTSNQTTTEVVLSIVKSKDFCVKSKVSLEDKVYLETYYHHNNDNIQVDETPTKIQVQFF